MVVKKGKTEAKFLGGSLRVISVAIIAFGTASTFAAQTYPYTDGIRQEGKVSANRINRIKFGDVPLTQVIGDESKYNIVMDERAVNIFLATKVPVGEQVDLFLINAAGEVADLNLKVEDIDSQTLEINLIRAVSTSIKKNEINQMLENMIAGRKGKYYVISTKRKIPYTLNLALPMNLEITQDQMYRYGSITGVRLKVVNKAKKDIILDDKDFAGLFRGSKAICIENKQLLWRGRSNVWIITEGDEK